MGDAARPGRRTSRKPSTWLSLLACVSLCAVAATTAAACGIDLVGTGPAPDAGAVDASRIDAGAALDGAIVDGGTQQTNACLAPRTACGSVCTDTTADPDNCNGCGLKCGVGETCNASRCEVLCVGGTLACEGACIDPKSDNAHCGNCTTKCSNATPLCLDGTCSISCSPKTTCPMTGMDAGGVAPYCADTMTDRNNCGTCMNKCNANELCQTGTCKAVCGTGATIVETFGTTMYGCERPQVSYQNRSVLCAAPYAICSPTQWTQRRGTASPKFNYWTSDELDYYGGDQHCAALSHGTGYSCGGSPMRVCGAYTDAVGNRCRWTGCGLGSYTNASFGGCVGDDYAGGLCCSP